MSQPTVLIISPSESQCKNLAGDLRRAGCVVETAPAESDSLRDACNLPLDVVLIPQDLPDQDSLELCRQIKNSCPRHRAPVLLLTPSNAPDVASAHRSSTFDLDRLLMGLETLVGWRRAVTSEVGTIACNGLEIDFDRHQAVLDGQEISLTPTEFRLLWTLARQPGRVFSRQQLSEHRGGEQNGAQVRTIDVHVKSIRQKLGKRADLIETVHGVGYRLRESEMASAGR